MGKDVAILLAWPETVCREAGGWYDPLMTLLGFNREGYYKVGHSAIVLVDGEDGTCHYFDFGRYNTPNGVGRVRDKVSDEGLTIHTTIEFDENGNPLNTAKLLSELEDNSACNGTGRLVAGLLELNFQDAFLHSKRIQRKSLIPYGPFTLNGTNCSRFTRTVALKGMNWSLRKLALKFPLTLSPTPIGNVLTGRKVEGQVVVQPVIYNGKAA